MEVSREIIQNILQDAVKAPSGDNAQPWRFAVKGNAISVFSVPDEKLSIFDTSCILDYLAVGAVLENMTISAEAHGFRATTRYFPNTQEKFLIASVELTETEPIKNSLYEAITTRTTNRRKYDEKPIEKDKLDALTSLSSDSHMRVAFVNTNEGIANVAHAVSAGEKIVLENKSIHDFLFQHVTWSKQDEEKRHGFYIKTFEFKPPQEILFKLFSNWNILSVFNTFGIANFIAKDMESVYRSSSAFGAILMQNPSQEGYVKCGMLMERLWLTATTLGLSMQPTTNINLLENARMQNALHGFSEDHEDLIVGRHNLLKKSFSSKETEVVAFVFRIGYALPASAQTTRTEPLISWEQASAW